MRTVIGFQGTLNIYPANLSLILSLIYSRALEIWTLPYPPLSHLALRLFPDRHLSNQLFLDRLFSDLHRDIHIPRPVHRDMVPRPTCSPTK